ncbi:MAG: LysE family translocator [Hyphomicrobiales bacterium]
MSFEFLVTSLIVVLLPGTGVLYTLAVGLGQGMRASGWAAFGCTLGIVPHLIASIVGLAALLHTSAIAFQAIKYLGVLYLFYMAWSLIRDESALNLSEERQAMKPGRIVLNGILLNVLNPKLSLFFLAFLPQFVPTGTATPTAMLTALALVFMAMTFFVFLVYGVCAAMARDYVISRPKVLLWLRRSFAGSFGLLGLRLAISDK